MIQESRRCFFSFRVTFLALAVLVTSGASAQNRPNILFFLVDDMGTQDTSVPFLFDSAGQPIVTANNKVFRTPAMEKLSRRGRRFTNAYAYSVCSPTRVSILTGQSAIRHRVTTWTHPESHTIDTGRLPESSALLGPRWNSKGVPPDAALLTKILKQAGYRTMIAGKAHFGPNDTKNGDPLNLGFDINIGGHGGGGPGSYHGTNNYSASWRGGGKTWDVPHLEKYHQTDTFLTQALTNEMAQAIEQSVNDGQPFFAYMSHYAVHAPFESDARFADHYPQLSGKSLAFATMVEGMDDSLGQLLDKLVELGVAENTLVVFYSDNGSDSPLGSKPLRGKKGKRYEGGSRVPLIVAWGNADPQNQFQRQYPIPANSIDDSLVSCVDMLPTLASIGGAKIPDSAVLDGQDFSRQITGLPPADNKASFLLHFPHGRHNDVLFTSFVDGHWKLIFNYLDQSWELYDLRTDIAEAKNLIVQKPQRGEKMATEMIAQLDKMQAQYPRHANSNLLLKPSLSTLPQHQLGGRSHELK